MRAQNGKKLGCDQLGSKRMILCLIGMLGSEKAYWSRKLADHGFQRIRCDGPIEELLRSDL